MVKLKNLFRNVLLASALTLGGFAISNSGGNKNQKNKFNAKPLLEYKNRFFPSEIHQDSINPTDLSVIHQPPQPNYGDPILIEATAVDLDGILKLTSYVDGGVADSIEFFDTTPDSVTLIKDLTIRKVYAGDHTYNAESIDSLGNLSRDPPIGPINSKTADNFKHFKVNRVTISNKPYWNLMFVPEKTNKTKSELFPTATSPAYKYDHGYGVEDTINPNIGFWLKFNSAETRPLVGDSVEGNNIGVKKGWNIIGIPNSFIKSIFPGQITSNPLGIIASGFFGYDSNDGYTLADTIKRNEGYWLKVTQDGYLTFNPSSALIYPVIRNGSLPPSPPGEISNVKPNHEQDDLQVYRSPNNSINFSYKGPELSNIVIYDVLGKEVKKISSNDNKLDIWDLTREDGQKISEGVYFYRVDLYDKNSNTNSYYSGKIMNLEGYVSTSTPKRIR